MQAIIFLLAVLFAIPSGGLSLLAYLIYLGLWAWIRAKHRMHYADTQRAYSTLAANPSAPETSLQSLIRRSEDAEVFFFAVIKSIERRGIPRLYAEALLMEPHFCGLLKGVLKSFEKDGHSFTSRQLAAAEFIERAWSRLPEEKKEVVKKAQAAGLKARDLTAAQLE